MDAVGPRAIVQLQGDSGLWAVGHACRDLRLLATGGISGPTFWQEQLAIEQAMKIVCRVGQMDGDDTVLLFAYRTQVLPLHAWRLLPLLHETGFIDDAHRIRMGMLFGNDILQAVTCQIFLPTMLAEKLLQRSHRHLRCQGNRLDTLAIKVRKLAPHINRQMRTRILACKAIVEAFQKTGEHRLQFTNLFGIHAWSSLTGRDVSFALLPKQCNIKLAL